jgi:HEAT repeat protein
MRVTSAMALANLAFRSSDARGLVYGDREIVDGLLLVVAPQDFVANISMLHRSAARKLGQFTGEDFRGRNPAWRAWWQHARSSFVGTRLALDITPENAVEGVLEWRDEHVVRRFQGEQALLAATAASGETERPSSQLVEEYALSGPELAALVGRLREQGFMTAGLLASQAAAELLPIARELDLRLGNGRCLVRGPAPPADWFDVLGAEIEAAAERERWQLYRDPKADRLVLWLVLGFWGAAHPERRARDARLVDRIVSAYPTLSEAERDRALAHLEQVPELRAVLTAEHVAGSETAIGERSFRMLELALLAPGDDAWREVLDIVDRVRESSDAAASDVLARVFTLLGPDKVLAAVADPRPRVCAAAIHEVAQLRDVRAVPQLLEAMGAADRGVREAAIYALGVLGAVEARPRLLALQADPATPNGTRRVVWVALGRIGGEEVLPILRTAAALPDLADQQSAIQALGELEDPDAADFLARIYVAHGANPLGTQAMASLQRMGSVLARPALRRHLGVRDPRVRRELVLFLAEFGEPAVVPDLMALIEEQPEQIRPVLLLSSITGLDLVAVNDRMGALRRWWDANGGLSQGEWFLAGLQRSGVETDLTADQLAQGAGLAAVDELSRLMVELEASHLRVLAAALLRDVTQRDFGPVSMQTPPAQLQAMADRYRFFADAERAAGGR